VLNFDMTTVTAAAKSGTGGLLLLGSAAPPTNLRSQLSDALAAGQHTVPPMVMADEEGGGIQRLGGLVAYVPWPRDMAGTLTPTRIGALAEEVGQQMRSLGVTVDLAPVLDVDGGAGPDISDPDGQRSFSPEPSEAARDGVAFMHGLQEGGVLPVVKHFPGLGGSSANTDYRLASTLPIANLERDGLLPFRAAIGAGASAVMVANATVPGLTDLPATLSSEVIDGLLRHDLGFAGLVLTDSLSAGAISQAGFSLPNAAVAAIRAGADMILFGSTLTPAQTALLTPAGVTETVHQIVSAISQDTTNGTLPLQRLDAADLHILQAQHVNLCP
jgi:beta-N-acetylhexosaminidase